MLCICYACDEYYAAQVGASLFSLYNSNQDREQFDTYVFADNLTADSINKIKSIAARFSRRLSIISLADALKNLRDQNVVSYTQNRAMSTWARILMPDLVPLKYDRMLYIDADTIITGQIGELCRFQMNEPMAAVVDIICQQYKDMLGIKGPYFNSGLLLIDLKKWRESNYGQVLLSRLLNEKKHYFLCDQDLINIVLNGHIAILPLKYNFFPFYGELSLLPLKIKMGKGNSYYGEQERKAARNDPTVIHLIDSVYDRPWFANNINPYTSLWNTAVKNAGWTEYQTISRKRSQSFHIKRFLYYLFGKWAVAVYESVAFRRRINRWKTKKHR